MNGFAVVIAATIPWDMGSAIFSALTARHHCVAEFLRNQCTWGSCGQEVQRNAECVISRGIQSDARRDSGRSNELGVGSGATIPRDMDLALSGARTGRGPER